MKEMNGLRERPTVGIDWRFGVHMPVQLEGLSYSRKFCVHTVIEEVTPSGFQFRANFESRVGDFMAVYLVSTSSRERTYAGQARILSLDAQTAPLISCRAQMLPTPPSARH